MKKLPQITALFWVLKIAATTLGETGGDEVAQTLHLGYLLSFFIFIAVFLVGVTAQLRAKRLHPPLYWTVIIATSTAGTTLSDFLDRSAGLGYLTGSLLIFSGLVATFLVWKHSGETFAVEQIKTVRGEGFYWTAILLSNTLGTAFGDYLSDSSGLHYRGSALLIAGVMSAILLLHYRTTISRTALFWTAFVLTRPLGATAGDLLWKPHSDGGLGLGSANVSFGLLVLIAGLTVYSARAHWRAMPLATALTGSSPGALQELTGVDGQRNGASSATDQMLSSATQNSI
jgi:uncharacterized membrane-anchored protein